MGSAKVFFKKDDNGVLSLDRSRQAVVTEPGRGLLGPWTHSNVQVTVHDLVLSEHRLHAQVHWEIWSDKLTQCYGPWLM